MNYESIVSQTGLNAFATSIVAKSLVPYRQCSAHRDLRIPGLSVRRIVDTAICSEPLAFAADAVRLWGLNRFSPAICRRIKLYRQKAKKRFRMLWQPITSAVSHAQRLPRQRLSANHLIAQRKAESKPLPRFRPRWLLQRVGEHSASLVLQGVYWGVFRDSLSAKHCK